MSRYSDDCKDYYDFGKTDGVDEICELFGERYKECQDNGTDDTIDWYEELVEIGKRVKAGEEEE